MRWTIMVLIVMAISLWSGCADTLSLSLSPKMGPAFPPGRRFAPSRFWAASPMLPLTNTSRHLRPAKDFVATGEANMLSWTPPAEAELTVPLSDSHSLVRLLGGGHSADGDVVVRNKNGTLSTRWDLLWSRLDTWANNGLATPILVLDNVPFAFCPSGKTCNGGFDSYGMNYGPANVTEYAEWIDTLLHAMVKRYGKQRASSFWFRVGTEPNTRPGHWNDTNTKYVQEYVAVATTIAHTLPQAKVGIANMGMDEGDQNNGYVMPMAQGIAASGARVDFLGMSCYGRGTRCSHDSADCHYSIATAALCDTRLRRMRSLVPRWSTLPAQVMEYGLQQNERHIVDDDPGAFGAAWMLATSVAHAVAGLERAFHWGTGEPKFSHDEDKCSASVSATPCGLYKGTAWVQAQAGHLFGQDDAVVLLPVSPGSNASTKTGVSADGIGGWSEDGKELRLLLTAFSPQKLNDPKPVRVMVHFNRSAQWAGSPHLQFRSARLNTTTAAYNEIYREAKQNGWLRRPDDPNVYRLSTMLTSEGAKALVARRGPYFLSWQRRSFAGSAWQDVSPSLVSCDDTGACAVSVVMAPPTVLAMWVRVV